MGKYRSKSGCLTCRQRRVKCDEVKPMCGNCGKKSRLCQWETEQTQFRDYRPETCSSNATAHDGSENMVIDGEEEDDFGDDEVALAPSRRQSSRKAGQNRQIRVQPVGKATMGLEQPSTLPFLSQAMSPASTHTSGSVTMPATFSAALPTKDAIALTRRDAQLVHHYAEHLGRWLDGTDPARQFTLCVPEQVKHCSILLHAVVCFAARHLRDDRKAREAYDACIELVIERLKLNTAMHDVDLLCAIVILRFFEQLNVPSNSGSDDETHSAGTSAILRSSQTTTVDPSASTLREAAFWVYVRQCLYNATINQQPPNVDVTLQLYPTPSSMTENHPLDTLRLETAWANQMTWNCARVTNFCFDGATAAEPAFRMRQWQNLWNDVQSWKSNHPRSFDPIWTGHSIDSVFPEMFFTADWHVVAFGFYHFCCILLLGYKPGPRFAMRTVGNRLSDTEHQILEHARAICGSCKSSPEAITCLITFCHTIFIWGPLVVVEAERREILEILANLENNQRWPTEWIVNALKTEWGIVIDGAGLL